MPLKDTLLCCVIHTASLTLQCMNRAGTGVVVNPVCCHGKIADYRTRAHPDAHLFAGREHSNFLGGTEALGHGSRISDRGTLGSCASLLAGLTHLNGLRPHDHPIQTRQRDGGQPCTCSWHPAPNEALAKLPGVPDWLLKVVILHQHSVYSLLHAGRAHLVHPLRKQHGYLCSHNQAASAPSLLNVTGMHRAAHWLRLGLRNDPNVPCAQQAGLLLAASSCSVLASRAHAWRIVLRTKNRSSLNVGHTMNCIMEHREEVECVSFWWRLRRQLSLSCCRMYACAGKPGMVGGLSPDNMPGAGRAQGQTPCC